MITVSKKSIGPLGYLRGVDTRRALLFVRLDSRSKPRWVFVLSTETHRIRPVDHTCPEGEKLVPHRFLQQTAPKRIVVRFIALRFSCLCYTLCAMRVSGLGGSPYSYLSLPGSRSSTDLKPTIRWSTTPAPTQLRAESHGT